MRRSGGRGRTSDRAVQSRVPFHLATPEKRGRGCAPSISLFGCHRSVGPRGDPRGGARAPRASWRRAEGARAPPCPSAAPGGAQTGASAGAPPAAPPRGGEQTARARRRLPCPKGAGRLARDERCRTRCRRQGSNLRLRGQNPPSIPTGPLLRTFSLEDPGGLEPPSRCLRGSRSTFELRVHGGPERNRTSTTPLKRRQLYR